MTNQLQGEILFKGWAGGNDAEWAYTPWMPVRGDRATFGVEVVSISGSITLTWSVQTREIDDPLTVSDIITMPPTVSAMDTSIDMNDDPVMQLVRYKFHTGSGASTSEYVVFRALQPSWQMDR
jgi:hypothetical protein